MHTNEHSVTGWRDRLSLYRALVIVLVVMFVGLQYQLWFSNGSLAEVQRLQETKERLQSSIEQARTRNRALAAEIENLQSGSEAMVGRARTELGMIKEGETFFLTLEPMTADSGVYPDAGETDDENKQTNE